MLWLRTLEPVDAPVNLGMKFALAIGTARRLEHDEADQLFVYTYPEGNSETSTSGVSAAPAGGSGPGKGAGGSSGQATASKSKEDQRGGEVQMYVREKVRVESADPSLLSLSSKLTALANTLSLARANLAAVMGENIEE